MVAPYYEQDGIAIYHGDCREVMLTIPRGSVDLLIADPPYGQRYSRHDRKGLALLPGDDNKARANALCRDGLTAAIKTLRPRRHVYVFGPFNLSGLPLRGGC